MPSKKSKMKAQVKRPWGKAREFLKSAERNLLSDLVLASENHGGGGNQGRGKIHSNGRRVARNENPHAGGKRGSLGRKVGQGRREIVPKGRHREKSYWGFHGKLHLSGGELEGIKKGLLCREWRGRSPKGKGFGEGLGTKT